MIQLFDVQDKKVCPAAVTYLVPELSAIMKNFPDEYLKVYAYIFFMTCPDSTNPYLQLPEMEKEEVILADLKPTFYLEDLSIITAIQKCKKLYETPTLRIRQGAKMMLDEMARKLQDSLTFGKDGNATDMRGIMKEIRGYTEDYMHLDNLVKEEQDKVRGGLKRRYDQMPGYIDMKSDEYKERNNKD